MRKEKLFLIPDKYLQINTKIQISLCDDDARLDPYMMMVDIISSGDLSIFHDFRYATI